MASVASTNNNHTTNQIHQSHQNRSRKCDCDYHTVYRSLASTTNRNKTTTIYSSHKEDCASFRSFDHQANSDTTPTAHSLDQSMTTMRGNNKNISIAYFNIVIFMCFTIGLIVGVDGAESRIFQHSAEENTNEFWEMKGQQALDEALRYQVNTNRAKNSIIFVGDGMSLSTITAARILSGQMLHNRSGEESKLSFESFPNVALVKTYNVDQQVPDSAATATAILCGIKSNFYTLGVNANVRLNDTDCQHIQSNHAHSIIEKAIRAGKSTGIVTNTRITHATPAAAYAHVSNRRWECDAYVPKNVDPKCKDIARQLIEDEPGNKINVIMGGGRRCFFGSDSLDPKYPNSPGKREDGRNLVSQWEENRHRENQTNYAFVNSTKHLRQMDIDKTDYLLGLFSFSHMSYEEMRDLNEDGEPSLSEMTEIAIKLLSKNPKGYILLVEGGRIDHAHHENVAGIALRETISFSDAVQTAVSMVDIRDTLITVTSDHAHALTINGLAPRGNSILGLSRFDENSTSMPYTTLIYGNGPGNHNPRWDPSVLLNTSDVSYYVQHAAIHQEEAFHDGTDVAVFAIGPYAHLFQGVQEQSYIAHVISYATCMGNIDHNNPPQHCDAGLVALTRGGFNNHRGGAPFHSGGPKLFGNNNLRLRSAGVPSITTARGSILTSLASWLLLTLILLD